MSNLLDDYELTKEQFRTFAHYCALWIRFFGLTDWLVEYEFRDVDDMGDMNACCMASSEDRQCKICLADQWDREPSDYALEQVAFHEVCELLLMDAYCYAVKGQTREFDSKITELHHAVIHRLTNSLFKEKRRAETQEESESRLKHSGCDKTKEEAQTNVGAVGRSDDEPQIGFIYS